MPKFTFEAVDKAGRPKSGAIDAKSTNEAREKLKAKGLFPTSVTQKGKQSSAKKSVGGGAERKKSAAMGSVKSSELTLFTRQFSTLIDAGLPMVRSMDILEQMLKPGVLRNTVMDVRDEVEQGASLSEAMAKSPKAFDEMYISMIRAGETSGLLGKILGRLAEFREKTEKLKKQIVGALIYPAAVLTIAGGILSLIVIFIIPKFQKMFTDMGVEMPSITQFLMSVSEVFVRHWYLVPIVPIGTVVSFVMIRKTDQGKYFTDLASLYIPVFGIIIKKSAISRFCRTLGDLSAAGVPILDSLAIIRTAVGNAVVARAVDDIHASIREGESVAEPMRRNSVFDIMVVNMVEVGEETGDLDKMLVKVADTYDNDVDGLVSSLMSLIEPFLIIGMGGTVAFIVIALFLPMISVIENMQ